MKILTIEDAAQDTSNTLQQEVTRFHDEYTDWMAHEGDDDQDFRPPGVHASEVSGCQRRFVYSLRGEPAVRKAPAKMKNIFQIGHLVHSLLQKSFHRFGRTERAKRKVTFRDEVSIDPHTNTVARTYNIYSSCDGVFTFWQNDEGVWTPYMRIGLEIKTMGPDEFKGLTAPKQEHIEQAHIYMACLDLPATWLLYVNKSNGQTLPPSGNFLVHYRAKTWDKLTSRIESAYDHVGCNTLPEREEDFPCTWCPYAKSCEPAYLKRYAEREARAARSANTTAAIKAFAKR